MLPLPCRMAHAPASVANSAALQDALELAHRVADFSAAQLALQPRTQDTKRIAQLLEPSRRQQGQGEGEGDATLLALLKDVASGQVAEGCAGALDEMAGLARKGVDACTRARELWAGMEGCA